MYALSNHPSPRPGFTLVAQQDHRQAGSVVVVISEYPGSMIALRRAAAEAGQRSAHLHIVDIGPTPGLEEGVLDFHPTTRDRDHLSALTILRNPNVTVAHVDLTDRKDLVECCRSAGASLLVVDLDYYNQASRAGGPLEALGVEADLTCDLLIVQPARTHDEISR